MPPRVVEYGYGRPMLNRICEQFRKLVTPRRAIAAASFFVWSNNANGSTRMQLW